MDNKCLEKAQSRIKAIANLQRDIAGEEKAIADYTISLKDLNAVNTQTAQRYVNKLLEIQQEERHHLNELEEMYRESFFWIREVLEDFADCECAARGNQVAASAKISQIKIQGRNPHAR